VADLRQRVNILERLLSISRRLNSTLEMRPLLQQIVESARELTDADGASILLMEDEDKLRFAAATGPDAIGLDVVEVPLEGSLAGWVVKHHSTAVLEDAQADSRLYNIRAIDPTRSIIAAPMLFGSEVIGVLESLTTTTRHRFTRQDRETIETLAGIAAVAVQNTRLFQQSDWVAEIVHEIRTPLTAILSYADLLQREDLDDAMRDQFVRTIQQETARVSRLATQFLDLAQLESGRTNMTREPVDLTDLMIRAANVIRPTAEERHQTLEVDLSSRLPTITGDPERLYQVLLNLLSNAVKYSDPGDEIQIRASVRDKQVILAVSDTGPGIPNDQLPQLFQKFRRLPSSDKKASGSGLGLVVAREIVEAHRGTIWVDSELQKGSTFFIALPIDDAASSS
jgi:signal transduction histidine kinase